MAMLNNQRVCIYIYLLIYCNNRFWEGLASQLTSSTLQWKDPFFFRGFPHDPIDGGCEKLLCLIAER